jgi:hypothetical protein
MGQVTSVGFSVTVMTDLPDEIENKFSLLFVHFLKQINRNLLKVIK